MTAVPNYFIDITNELCPMTFVKAKLAVERAQDGDTIEVRLQGAEPLRNVPRSMREIGHQILSLTPEMGEGEYGIHRMLVRKV